MLKKVAVLAGAASLLLAAAVPALAYNWYQPQKSVSNVAVVENEVSASANTGNVTQGNGVSAFGAKGFVYGGRNYAETGNAGAQATGVVVANTTLGGRLNVKNFAVVDQDVSAQAGTGNVKQGNGVNVVGGWHGVGVVGGGSNTAVTGDALAVSSGWTVVNTTWSH